MANRTIDELDAVTTADALAAGLANIEFETQILGLTSPTGRKITATQVQELLVSSSTSAAVSAGLAASVSLSGAVSAGLAASVALSTAAS